MIKLPIATDEMIPHRAPFKMIDQIVSFDDDSKSSVLEYTVKENSPFLNPDGSLDGESFLEIIAQAAAAQHGFNLKREGAKEELGFLVGVRDLQISGQAFKGDTVTVQVECGTEIETVSAVSGSISKAGKEIASALITVWHGNKTPA